ncbi:LysM peptidoglycan-binding domain-containing protein [bacterium]|nr:LysM peptidoglycan-binding domain-containing protein [bacterium]
MKSSKGLTVLLSIIMVLLAGVATVVVAQSERDSVTYNGVTYLLPKARDQITLPANVPEQVKVISGDTLWGIAARVLNDPFLWPLIWENNMSTVPNPHLIYPDQILLMPRGGMVVPSQAGLPEGVVGERIPIGTTPEGQPIYAPLREGEITLEEYLSSQGFLLASHDVLDSCGFITQTDIDVGSIISSEEEITQLSDHDIIYLNIGENDNVKAGDLFTIFKYDRKLRHPHTRAKLGQVVTILGRCKILCTQLNTSTAIIIKTYDSMEIGHKITPYIPRKMMYRDIPPEQPFCKQSSGELSGTILDVQSGAMGLSDGVLIGEDDIVFLDKGSDDGVALGQYFAAFEHNKRGYAGDVLTRISHGKIVIIKVENKFATGLVIRSLLPIYIGDYIDLIK